MNADNTLTPQELRERGLKELRWFEKRLFKYVLLPLIILFAVALSYFIFLFATNENFNFFVRLIVARPLMQWEQARYEKQLREDPYGGETPEEVIVLFVDALKKGDLELASKYIVLERREKYLDEMKEVQERSQLPLMIRDFEREKIVNSQGESYVWFDIIKEDENLAIGTIAVIKMPSNLWKIESY